jgi:hypothetical protein
MADDLWREHSVEADWEAAAFAGYPSQRAAGELLAMFGYAPHMRLLSGFGLQWLEIGCQGLATYRKIADHWRSLVRDQQDAFLAGLRDQLCREQARSSAPHAQAAPQAAAAQPKPRARKTSNASGA